MCPTITVGSFFFRHERSTFCSFVQQPPQLQTSTTPTSEASKTKKQNRRPQPRNHTKDPTFFRNYATSWNFLDWNFFPKGSPLQFCLMFCNTMDVKKSQRVPLLHFSALWHCSNISLKKIFGNFFMSPKGPPFNFFKIFCNQLEFHKARRVPLLYFEP